MGTQDDALRDVDRASVWGVLVAVLGVLALVGLIWAIGRDRAVFVIPIALVTIALVVARPGRRRS